MNIRNITALLLAAALFLFASCGGEKKKNSGEFTDSRMVMSRTAEVKMLSSADKEQQVEAALNMALGEMERLGYMLDVTMERSLLSLINIHAAKNAFDLSDKEELFNLFSNALTFSEMSEGAFDITVAPLRELWGFYSGNYYVPAPHQVAEVMKSVGYGKLHLNLKARSVAYTADSLRVDFGDYGRGYAVNQASILLKNKQLGSFFIDLDNIHYGFGAPTGEDAWTYEILYPAGGDAPEFIARARLNENALAVVGQETFAARGEILPEVLDPRTGYPATELKLAAVVSASPAEAAALANMFFVMGKDETLRFLSSEKYIGVVLVTEGTTPGVYDIEIAGGMKNYFQR